MLWVNYDLLNRKSHLPCLLELIKLPLLSPQYLADHIENNPLLKESNHCRNLIMEAMKYHLLPERRSLLHSPRTRPRKSTVGSLFMIGGMDGGKGSWKIEKYDLRSNTWSIFWLNDVKTFTTWAGCWRIRGPLYAVGGHDGWTYLSAVERWDSSTRLWSYVAPLNTQRSTAGVAVLNDRLYAVGGRDGSSCLRSVECFDPHRNKWSFCAPMSIRRGGAGVGVINSYLFALGGHDAPILNPGVSRFECVERYDPRTDTWTLVAPMRKGRDAIGVGILGDRLIAAGGHDGQSYFESVGRIRDPS
ncbi:kelch-like protein 5, partial [Caerostris extrusa]